MAKLLIIKALQAAIERARRQGKITLTKVPGFSVERPQQEQFGDFSSNAALMVAKATKENPRVVAQTLIEDLTLPEGLGSLVERVEIAGPGFLNFYLHPNWLWEVVREAVLKQEAYGRWDEGKGAKVLVEYVSANPTGPLHLGNARGGVIGDVVANLLEAIGYDVEREFYINDVTMSTQVQKFGKSLEARYMQLLGYQWELPENGYKGAYLTEIAQELLDEAGQEYAKMGSEERAALFTRLAMERILKKQRQALAQFGMRFDNWVSEQWLYDSQRVSQVLERLKLSGHTYEQEGALWLRTTQFDDYKDEVLVRSNGAPTYFAADIAYHAYKFERGYKFVIDVWGADHHGHVPRMKAALRSLNIEPDRLIVLLYQFLRLFKGGELVEMSKREGEMVTLEDLLNWVDKDAARYFLLMRSTDSHLDFDLDLAVKQSSENPVYYVQYMHARCCSIFKQAKGHPALKIPPEEVNLQLLTHESEKRLMRDIADFPEEVRGAALTYEPHRLTTYAQQLANTFHADFYANCRVIGDDIQLSAARLMLVKAAHITVQNLLRLLGISAPEQM